MPTSLQELRPFLNLVAREQMTAQTAHGYADREGIDRTYPDRIVLANALSAENTLTAAEHIGIAGTRTADLGCGPAYGARLLLDAGAECVDAVDQHPGMLAMAATLPGEEYGERLNVIQGDISGPLPLEDEAYDLVWVGDVWMSSLNAEIRRILRPGGRLVLRTTGPREWLPRGDAHFVSRVQEAIAKGLYKWLELGGGESTSDDPGPQLDQQWRTEQHWTDLLQWSHPVPEIVQEYLLQTFADFEGRFARSALDAVDWERLAWLVDPRRSGHLLESSGVHVSMAFTYRVLTPLQL